MNNYPDQVKERFAQLPVIGEPDKESTCVLMPMYDSRIEYGTVRGLMESASMYNGVIDLPCCSEISYARNRLLNAFLNMRVFQWAVLIDADIVFSAADFKRLVTGNDYAVNGVYAKKDSSGQMVTQGLGFARIHRCVLESLAAMPELCVPFTRYGETLHGFCFSGPTGVNGVYLGEDQSFWFMLAQIGVRPRIETELNLTHIGRAEYRLNVTAPPEVDVPIPTIM